MAGEIVNEILRKDNFNNVSVGPGNLSRLNALYNRPGGQIRKLFSWSVEDHDNARCLRVFHKKGTHGQDNGFGEWVEMADGPAGLQECWFGLHFKWQAGFQYVPAGKFMGATVGGFNDTDGRFASGGQGPASYLINNKLGGSLRLRPVQLSNGNLGLALYIYDYIMDGKYGRGGPPVFGEMIPGQWHEIAVRLVMNNPLSSNNGICQVWLDKQLVGSYRGIAWARSFTTAKGFQYFAASAFLGGSGPIFESPIDQSVWVKSTYLWSTNNPKGNELYGKNEIVASLMGDLGAGGTAPVPVVPTGVPVITNITPSRTSASITYSYAPSDATIFEYRLNEGNISQINTSPFNITGLSPSTSYSVEIRAKNAVGEGSWSLFTQFTTLAIEDAPIDLGGNPLPVAVAGIGGRVFLLE